MTDFVFVRHGQSQANAEKVIASNDTPLSEQGGEEANDVAQEIRYLGINLIACSPMTRARQTAAIIAAQLGIDPSTIKVIDELRERGLGKLEGHRKEMESDYYYKVGDQPDNELLVESRQDTLERMTRCLNKIKALAKEGKLLVVGHAISGYYLIEAAKGKTSAEDLDPPSEIGTADFLVLRL